MSLEPLIIYLPAFVLVFFRVAGMMLAAPLFGSARVPRRVKLMMALVVAMGLVPAAGRPVLPQNVWQLAAGITGELLFGLAIGTALSFIFVAVNWAGEIMGQQMGLGIGHAFDPSMGQAGSVVGDLYFMLTIVIFLSIGGHRALLWGVWESLHSLPLLSVTMTQDILDLVVGLLQSATALAVQLAAPMLLTMLLTDVVLGFLSKTIPQLNVMSAGLSLRAMLGMAVLIVCVGMSSNVIRDSMSDALRQLSWAWAR
jgi:flagellar biosynthetic protein FliR